MKKNILLAFAFMLLSTAVFTGFAGPVVAEGAIYIRADGSIDPDAAPISTVDNITYTFTDNIYDEIVVERDNIVVDGAGHSVEGTGAFSSKGIDLTGRRYVTIKNTEIKAFDDGIYLYGSSGNIISGNKITKNTRGIWLYGSSNNGVFGTGITDNKVGVWLHSSSNNTISRSNITKNYYYGVRLEYSSFNNTVSGNNITKNEWFGVWLYNSFNNKFYHNNFIDNRYDVWCDYESTNVWDDGVGKGNYWRDYEERYPNATEIDDSGIWDTPYVINENNKDNYPIVPESLTFTLMLPILITLTVSIAICKRRLLKTPIH